MALKTVLLACALATLAVDQASASLITAATPEMNDVITFDEFDGTTTTHITSQTLTSVLGESVGFLSTPTSSIGPVVSAGSTNNYNFGANGLWDASKRFIATDNAGSLQFTFSTAVQSFGAFFNYYVNPAQTNNLRGFTITALDADGTVIETDTVKFLTGGGVNDGRFFGITSNSANIKTISVTDGLVALDNLQFASAVPEPSTLGLMAAALFAVGFVATRNRRQ